MDEPSHGETTQVQVANDSKQPYLTAYAVINILFYALVGAFIGWRGGFNAPFTLGSGTMNGSIGGLFLGAVIGIAFSIFFIGMSWDQISANNLIGLIEGLGISLGFLLGIVLIIPSLYRLIDRFGYGHLLAGSSFCVQAPLFLVCGMLGAAVGVFAGRILIQLLNRINPRWVPEVQWRVADQTKLDAYFKQMEELHLSEDALQLVRKQARELTLAVLPTLHSEAKWKVLAYLSETCRRYPELSKGLITRGNPIINLHGADLTGQSDWGDLYDFDLSGTDLRGAKFGSAPMAGINLSGADLRQANLGTSLANADFCGADLRGANLYHAHLNEANFTHADLRGADLRHAYGLETAIFDQAAYNGRTQWPENFNPQHSGAVIAENGRSSP